MVTDCVVEHYIVTLINLLSRPIIDCIMGVIGIRWETVYIPYSDIFMPRCACASEVYGSVFVCVCVCLSGLLQLLRGSMKCK